MRKKKNYTYKDIIKSKTPEEYIDRLLNSKLTLQKKIHASNEWQERTGYTVEDIKYARHRHPYWKMRKGVGNEKRYRERNTRHNYRKPDYQERGCGGLPIKVYEKFWEIDVKKDGKYVYTDWQLAKKFNTTIPGIQALRRKKNLVLKLYKKPPTKMSKKIQELITTSEITLRKYIKDQLQ